MIFVSRWLLTEADLEALELGAALLGTGGGGNPYIGKLRTREELRRGNQVTIVTLDKLPEDGLVVSLGGIGAPVVGVEKLGKGDECLQALRLIEETVGRRAVALIAAEIGGANAMEPMLTAAQAGIPVVDGDGMGRAFPEVQMMTYLIYGHPATPAAIADEKGNRIVFRDTVDMFWLERFARSIVVDMGGTAGFAIAPMRVDFLKRYAIPGTVSQAVALGQTIQKTKAARKNVADAICREEGGIRLFAGKITGIQREFKGGFVVGEVALEGISAHAGETGRIAIQNENLVFWRDGRMEACVPDLIVNVQLDTGEPITTEMLRYGQRIATLALPAHELLKTPRALAVVGPSAIPTSPTARCRRGTGDEGDVNHRGARGCAALLAAGCENAMTRPRSGGDSEQTGDEGGLSMHVALTNVPNLPLSDHRHCLVGRA